MIVSCVSFFITRQLSAVAGQIHNNFLCRFNALLHSLRMWFHKMFEVVMIRNIAQMSISYRVVVSDRNSIDRFSVHACKSRTQSRFSYLNATIMPLIHTFYKLSFDSSVFYQQISFTTYPDSLELIDNVFNWPLNL